MMLTPPEAEVFFRLWSCIDTYVNRRTQVIPGVDTPEQARLLQPQQVFELRAGLWASITLLDDFVRDNPFALSTGELQEVQAFRRFVQGTFYVERCLKKHAIFVSADRSVSGVYAVIGLTQGIDDLLYHGGDTGYGALITTVLLPFRGRVVWDGIVSVQNITFGAGIRRQFKDAYVRAKDRGEIIGSFDTAATPRQQPRTVDWRASIESIVQDTEKLGKTNTTLQAASFRLLKLSAQIAKASLEEPLQAQGCAALVRKATSSMRQLIEAIERERLD